jgi:hypothetical protein
VARRWFKGNLHAHTANSDGDATPDEVVAWYRDAGYDLLALTDHDLRTLPADHHYRTTLIGHGGQVLDNVDGAEPRYRYRGYQGYVHARVEVPDGHRAWLQASFVA